MEVRQSAPRAAQVLRIVESMGDVLWLQLLFVAACLPVVTIFPAALALQRSLRDVLVEGRPRLTAGYWANLKWATARSWRVAIILPVFMLAAFTAAVFWLGAHGTVGAVALCILIPLYGAALAGYLAVLASSMSCDRAAGLSDWLTAARDVMSRRALPLAMSVIVMATWFLLLSRLPTLVLVGTGLVPAALTWWVAAPWIQARREALAA